MSKTRHSRKRQHTHVLHSHVISGRLIWLACLGVLGKLGKLACVLAVLAGIGWGIWQGFRHAVYQNPDFSLKMIQLNKNPLFDEAEFAEATQLNLTGSIFDVDTKGITAYLNARAEVLDAHVERHLPDTLNVTIRTRVPKIWVVMLDHPMAADKVRRVGGLVADSDGFLFPCSAGMMERAMDLPIVRLTRQAEHPLASGKLLEHPELRHALRLYAAVLEHDSQLAQQMDVIRQVNAWSLEVKMRQGVTATLGMGDYARQIRNWSTVLKHSESKGYDLATVQLIPKRNIPITLRSEPQATMTIQADSSNSEISRDEKKQRDLKQLLNRN